MGTLLFSGGGEYCLVAWHLHLPQRKCALAKKFLQRKQADCRVMSLTSFWLPGEGLSMVVLGMSHARIEVMGYHALRREFTRVDHLVGHYGPVLAVDHVAVASSKVEGSSLHY